MKSYEMVETLSEKTKVSLAEAKEALEKSNWDMLDAAIYIEEHKPHGRPPKPPINDPMNHGFVSGYQPGNNGQFGMPTFGNEPKMSGHGINNQPNYTHFSGAPQPPFGNPPFGQPQYEQPPVSFGEMLGRFCGRTENAINSGMQYYFVVRKRERCIFRIPLLVFIIALIVAFFPIVPLMIIGLFFDFRFSFERGIFGSRPLDEIFSRAKTTTEKMKEDFLSSRDTMKEEYRTMKDDFQKGINSTKM